MIEIIGAIAATCTTFSFFPQILHIYRTRSTESISLGMYSFYSIGLILWVLYGWSIASVPVILANLCTLLFSLCILSMKLRWN